MSSEWPLVAIENVCSLIVDCVNKTAPVSAERTPYRMIRTTNVRKGRIDLTECRYVERETYEKWTRRAELKFGDVILTREAPIGEVGFVTEHEGVFLGQRLMQYRADPKKLDPRFLLYSFLSPDLQHQFGSHEGSGSVVSHIRVGDCFKFKMRLPPLKVQREIGAFLRALDDRIALLRETNTILEAIAQALFKSWFVDFDPVHANAAFLENEQAPSLPAEIQALFPSRLVESPQGLIPEGWEVFRLGDVTERITKGTTPTTLKKAFTEEGINFVKVESLTENGEFINEKFSYIDEETHQLLKRSQLKPGDVLVTIAGTIGRVAEVTEDIIPANTNQAVALIRPIQQKLPSGLIRRFLQRNDSKQHMGERVVQAVQANLSLGSLSDMAVVVPPEAVVGKLYALAFEHIDTSKNNNMRQIKTLTNLRDTLLPRLISGQLRLPEVEAALAEVAP